MNDSRASIYSLVQQLPEPDAVYRIPQKVCFEVYRVKNSGTKFWRDPVLKELLIYARNAYHVYGRRDPLDEYDPKASIYLVRAIYDSDDGSQKLEEWLSSRLVSGIGQPLGAGELNMYFYEEQPMDYWVRKPLGYEDSSFWNYVICSSRMCGIDPYIRESKGNQKIDTALKHTPVSNAILRTQFLIDNEHELPCKLVTAIIREDLRKNRISVMVRGEKIMRVYTMAHEFLGIENPHAIMLDRDAFAYEFPSYWLDISQLLVLLGRLQDEGRLSEDGIRHYIGGSIPLNFNSAKLGLLLAVDGKIHDSSMTGEELRVLVDKYVDEKPILRITDAREWFGSYLRILDRMEVDIFEQNPKLRNFLTS